MTMTNERLAAAEFRRDLAALRRKAPWFVVLGMALILLGTIAMASQVIASLATAVLIGWLLLFAGVAEIVGAFSSRRWSGFFLHLLSGLLSAVVGILFVRMPLDAALALTMLLACLLVVGGTFKMIASTSYRFEGWGWPLASGIIDLILGVMIWLEWPASGLWVIGLFVGISLVFRGFNWIGLGLALRSRLNAPADGPGAPGATGIATVELPSPVTAQPAHAGQ
jgi:uncharacterized membrane protein HdeD (DUF308 family)